IRGVFCVNTFTPNDSYKIIDFLKNPNQRTDQKIKYLTLNFVLVRGDLFRKIID
ncbi:hypothetical protein S83_004614, partial [Arachis hypogaea]